MLHYENRPIRHKIRYIHIRAGNSESIMTVMRIMLRDRLVIGRDM